MRVLYTTYQTAFQFKGGGEVILSKCREYLEKEKVKVKLYNMWEDRLKDYDLLHNFSVFSECLPLIDAARQFKVPVALHTIYWPQTESALKGSTSLSEKAKKIAYTLSNKYDILGSSKMRAMMKKADILFPNSKVEGIMLEKEFKAEKSKIHVVHDGVDSRFFKGSPKEFEKKFGLKDFALYVGRIEPRKNVLGTIRAMKGSEIPLVIVGEGSSTQQDYFEKCKKEAGKNVHFLGRIEHDSSLLVSAYNAARVLALPSWYETPGIVALEAAAAGTRIVITDRGCTKEYFNDFASYVNPNDTQAIRKSIEDAFRQEKNPELARLIKKEYTWEKVAKELIEGYKKII